MLSKDALKDFPLRWVTRHLVNPYFMALQRQQIEELTLADKTFPAELRLRALEAVGSRDREVVRCGLSALAFVGMAEDAAVVQALRRHANKNVARDAGTCLFEIKQRSRRA